jgi:hypothetical protein
MAFGHFLLGSHNCMVMTLGSCVKWPLDCNVWGDLLSIIGQDPSVSKSNQLHVVIFRFFFINLRYSYRFLDKDWQLSLSL